MVVFAVQTGIDLQKFFELTLVLREGSQMILQAYFALCRVLEDKYVEILEYLSLEYLKKLFLCLLESTFPTNAEVQHA